MQCYPENTSGSNRSLTVRSESRGPSVGEKYWLDIAYVGVLCSIIERKLLVLSALSLNIL